MSNPFIYTYTGKKFYPLNPRIEDVDIIDIGHSLSLICRFNGHSKKFYSVAEHVCHVCDLCSKDNKLAGLCHDNSEYALGDVVRPLKPFLTNYYKSEETLEILIAKKFEYKYPYDKEVTDFDHLILQNEFRDLFDMDVVTNIDLDLTNPWTSKKAEREFLKRFEKYKNI